MNDRSASEQGRDDQVQQQYEAYPYPARNPADEAKRLITGSPSNLAEINHYLFGGRRDFTRPFRALVAGGGTGDATVMLAQQLADCGDASVTGGEVTYFDLSQAARRIAEARIEARGLKNVSFVTGSIEALPELGLGPFDYIDCCGVLHHLADPAAGLAALKAVLAGDGGIGLMVYGEYGRTGLYPLQAVLRSLTGDLPLDQRVVLARKLIAGLPATNWFRRNSLMTDHQRSDAELVDLCLHARDRAYTVPQLVALVREAGLAITAMIEPLRYEPSVYLRDPLLLQRLRDKDPIARAAIAEIIAGNMRKHVAYLARPPEPNAVLATMRVARPDGPDVVPLLRELDGDKLAEALRRDGRLKAELDGLSLTLTLPPLAPAILSRVDGETTLAAIHEALRMVEPTLGWPGFKTQFDQVYGPLNGLNRMLLRCPGRVEIGKD